MTAEEIKVIHNIFKSYEAVTEKLLKLAKSHSSDPAKAAEIGSLESEKKLLGLNMYEQLSPGKRGRPPGTAKKELAGVPPCIEMVRRVMKMYPHKDKWDSIVNACDGKSKETMYEDMLYFYNFWTNVGSRTSLTWLLHWYKDNVIPPNVALTGNPRPEHAVKTTNGFKKQSQNQPAKEEPLTDEDNSRIAAIIARKSAKTS